MQLLEFHMLTMMITRSNPCHIELILTEGEEVVQKSPEVVNREQGKHLNSRQRAQRIRKQITQG
jgi:large subunit ribosomal protein L17e